MKVLIKKLKSIFRRDCRKKLLEMMPKRSVCAEIGVWKGEYSRQIYKINSPKELHLIDPWEFMPQFFWRLYVGNSTRSQEDIDKIYQMVQSKFENNNNVYIHKGISEKVLKEFPDGYFDWIYIDGDHSYETVIKDLNLSFLKVKSGGFISGDDYYWKDENKDYPVRRAVQYFTKEKKIEGNLKRIGGQFIIRKPQ